MLQPIAVPKCAGIVPDHGQDYKRPSQQEKVACHSLPNPNRMEQSNKITKRRNG